MQWEKMDNMNKTPKERPLLAPSGFLPFMQEKLDKNSYIRYNVKCSCIQLDT